MPQANPLSIIDFDEDYYAVLGVKKEDLPKGRDTESRKFLRIALQTAYRERIFEVHPDRGGSPAAFKAVVRAHTILSDPILRDIYDKGEVPLDGLDIGMKIDWTKLGKYRKGSLADQEGTTLFLMIIEKSGIPNVSPVFAPNDPEFDNYSWEFSVPGMDKNVILSIVDDEDEVLKLTDGTNISDEIMPFKIYIYIPNVKMVFVRKKDSIVTDPDGVQGIVRGRFSGAEFRDINFLSTTDHDVAREFITGGGLESALGHYVAGTYEEPTPKRKASEPETAKLVDPYEQHRVDQKRLQDLVALSRRRWREEEHPDHDRLRPGSHLDRETVTDGENVDKDQSSNA